MSQCGTDKQLKIELLSQWKLEAEFRNIVHFDNEDQLPLMIISAMIEIS